MLDGHKRPRPLVIGDANLAEHGPRWSWDGDGEVRVVSEGDGTNDAEVGEDGHQREGVEDTEEELALDWQLSRRRAARHP